MPLALTSVRTPCFRRVCASFPDLQMPALICLVFRSTPAVRISARRPPATSRTLTRAFTQHPRFARWQYIKISAVAASLPSRVHLLFCAQCPPTTPGSQGQLGIIPEHLVEDMPLLGLFFPPSSCLTTLATRAPSRVFCHAVTVYAHYGAPFSCGWDLKFCFAVGKDLFLCLWC